MEGHGGDALGLDDELAEVLEGVPVWRGAAAPPTGDGFARVVDDDDVERRG